MKRGCRGLAFGGKATVLDTITILNDIWSVDGRYAREDGISRCWRKAKILPGGMRAEIEMEHGSNSVPAKEKKLTEEDCHQLCSLMRTLQVKVSASSLDCNNTAIVFQDSFVSEGEFTNEEYSSMATNWIDIEDEEEVVNAVIDDEIETIEKESDLVEDDDDPEPEAMVGIEHEEAVGFLDAEEMIRKLKLSCGKLGVPSAEIHLERFGRALREAKNKKPKKSPTLHSFGYTVDKTAKKN